MFNFYLESREGILALSIVIEIIEAAIFPSYKLQMDNTFPLMKRNSARTISFSDQP